MKPNVCSSDSSILNVLTVRQVREKVNRMLVKQVFVEVEALTGKPFDIDACCDDEGVNSHCDPIALLQVLF